MKYLFFILLSFNIYAQDDSCVALETSPLNSGMNKLLEWFGAVDAQVEKAPCKTKTLPTQDEMLKFINSASKALPITDTIHGVRFTNENPFLIRTFKEFTTAKDSFGLYKLDSNQKKIAAEYKIGAECSKVLCAMEKIWGKEYSIKLLYLKIKHGFNSSELAFENSDRFSNSEIDDVIIGLEDLAPHLQPLAQHNQRLTHFKRGYTLKQYSGSTIANAVVMIFDPWDKKSRPTKQYSVFHEMAHNISSKLDDMDESPEWLKLSGWVKKGDDWSSSPNACQTSRYGQTNPWEDFAESLSSFRYNGAQFKKKCPQKFEFIKKKVFRGMDYTDVKNCMTVPNNKIQAAQKSIADEIMNSIGSTQFDEKEMKESCEKGFSAYPIPEKELAYCSLKLHSVKALSGSNSKISEALTKAGIPDTAANRDLVLTNFSNSFTEDMMDEIARKSTNVAAKAEEMLNQSFTAANPEGFSKKKIPFDDYRFRTSLKECGMGFFTAKLEEVKQCQLKALINQDRDYQRWDLGVFPAYKAPSIFFNDAKGLIEKREQVLLEHISKHPLADEMVREENKRYLDGMRYHYSSVQFKIDKIPDWKKMTPEAFCKETYGGGTSWTEEYGATAGAPIPKLYDACVNEQSKRSKRFEMKEDNWMKLVTD